MPTNRVIREEEIKNRIREDFFKEYDATQILGDIDFAVTVPTHKNELPFEYEYFLWAEAKKGNKEDLVESFVQLILTIGKNGLHNTYLPPKYIGAFDGDKITFVEFHFIIDVLYQNDFNWRVTPSNHETKEFKLLLSLVQDKLSTNMSLFYYNKDEKDLRRFIKSNFVLGKKSMKLPITKNNYIFVFQRWVEEVKPSIDIDWNDIPQTRVVDFFYADLISRDDYTRIDNLAVVLRGDHYLLLEEIKKSGRKLFSEAAFKDEKKAYTIFSGINTIDLQEKNILKLFLRDGRGLYHRILENIKVLFSRHLNGWKSLKITFLLYLVKIGRKSIMYGTVPLVRVIFYLV